MASFVEQATLKVRDQSTAQINRINAALKQLRQTANSLKNVRIRLDVNDAGIKRATAAMRALRKEINATKSARIRIDTSTGSLRMAQAQVKNLTRDLRNLRAQSAGMRAVKLTVNSNGVQQATQRIKALQQAAGRQIKMPPVAAPHVPGVPRGGGGGRGGSGAPNSFLRGAASGLGYGGMVGAFGSVTSAGYLAAAALRKVADAAASRDRSLLKTGVAATPEQRALIEKEISDTTKDRGPIPFTKDVRRDLLTSLLGNVPGAGTAEAVPQAAMLVDMLERQVYPRQYAMAEGDETKAREGLKKLVQSIDMASGAIIDRTGKSLTPRAGEVLKGIQLAIAGDPDIEPHTIKTGIANLKTAAQTMSAQAIARSLLNIQTRGMRGANEIFQAVESLGGNVDSKALNQGLVNLGLVSKFKPKPGKAGAKGGVLPGSGEVIGGELLDTDFFSFAQAYILPKLLEQTKKERAARVAEVKKRGGTQGELDEANQPSETDTKKFITRNFPTMRQTARMAVYNALFGYEQDTRTLRQATASADQPIDQQFANSVTTQWDKLKNVFKDIIGDTGATVAEKTHLADFLKGLGDLAKENPNTALATAAAGATVAIGGMGVAAGIAAKKLMGLNGLPGMPPTNGPGGKGPGPGPRTGQGRMGSWMRAGAGALANPGVWAGAAALGLTLVLRKLIASTISDPSGQTNQILKTVQAQLDAAKRAAATEINPELKAQAQAQVTELTAAVKQLTEQLAYQEGETPANWIQSAIDAAKQFNKIDPSTFDWGGVPLPKKPTVKKGEKTPPVPKATMPSLVPDQLPPAQASWLDSIKKTEADFQTVFSGLPAAAGEAGKSFNTSSISGWVGAAESAGEAFGNRAAGSLKAQLSDLTVNVKANVSTTDTGGNTEAKK